MSLVVVGMSHHSAPLELLSEAGKPEADHVLRRLAGANWVDGVALLRTCNRLEIYADVRRFHGAVEAIVDVVADEIHVAPTELVQNLYVHFDSAAVEHTFKVACGLDSMAVGEAQVLGQLRTALRQAQETDVAGATVGRLLEHGLRVGKRAHSETNLDLRAGSLVETALDLAAEQIELASARILVLGAGTMAGLVMSSLSARSLGNVAVLSRTTERARRLADTVQADVLEPNQLHQALGMSDLVIATAGATGYLVTRDDFRQARTSHDPMAVIDIALPVDVDPQVAHEPGVALIDLARVGDRLSRDTPAMDLSEVHAIVAQETAAFEAVQLADSVTPTVIALREQAAGVVAAELARLEARLPELDEATRAELANSIHRVVDKLLHNPTVRVKQLAGERASDSYATVLQDLFNLSIEEQLVSEMNVRDTQQVRGAS